MTARRTRRLRPRLATGIVWIGPAGRARGGAAFLAAHLLLVLCGARPVLAQASSDPLAPFLRGLADSTDALFGRDAASFDTTGIDSLILVRGSIRPASMVPSRPGIHPYPVVGFHRATGFVAGAGGSRPIHRSGSIDIRGSYGFAHQEGRYRFALSWPVTPASLRQRGALAVRLAYARETIPFASEHATPFSSALSALCTGLDQQSVYERRGGSVELSWGEASRFATIGWRAARDQSMDRATTFSLWGADSRVPGVTPARGGSYAEGFIRLAFTRAGLSLAGAEGQFTSRARWRARLAAAQTAVLLGCEAHLQAEAGISARPGPAQNRFELGGPLAIPSLRFGDEAGNRLLLGKIELVHGIDLIRTLRVPYLRFMVLHPAIFAHGASVWTSPDGDWSEPPAEAWRGAAGFALVDIPGYPTPETYIRMQMAWPVGREGGTARFSASIGRRFDLIPKR